MKATFVSRFSRKNIVSNSNYSNFLQPAVPFIQRKCNECEEKNVTYRKAQASATTTAPSHVHTYVQALNGSGHNLPQQIRNFFEKRFSTSLTNVKIHTGIRAQASAEAIHAKAYTVGNNIVFNKDQYQPETFAGKKLLAHELTHVLQQANQSTSLLQRITCEGSATAPGRVAQGQPNPLDTRANDIIAIASDANLSSEQKAINIVTQIICQYYPGEAALVNRIVYESGRIGLGITSVGRGTSTRGNIKVGDQFVSDTTSSRLSRRILQVGHELEHIRQYRSGMAGANNQDQREFLAFANEALADEFEGTGRVSRSTRVALIDGAIGYYFCLSSELQQQYQARLEQLQQRRQTLISSGRVRAAAAAPTSCRRQS